MSHINVVKVQMKNEDAVMAAAKHLGLTVLGRQKFNLYEGAVEGLGLKLEGWRYPVVLDLETGEVKYDNYNGSWGDQIQLDRLVQRYGVECARLEAEMHGYQYQETLLPNGDVEVELLVH